MLCARWIYEVVNNLILRSNFSFRQVIKTARPHQIKERFVWEIFKNFTREFPYLHSIFVLNFSANL